MRYLVLFLPIIGFAQQVLTLEDCYRLARDHYPTIQKLDLITRSEDYTLAMPIRLIYLKSVLQDRPLTSPKLLIFPSLPDACLCLSHYQR